MVWPCLCPVSDLLSTCPPLTLFIKYDLNVPVYILLPSTRPDSCNGHKKVSNAFPEPDRSCLHLDSYTSAVPNQMCPLLLKPAQSCSLCFGFSAQWCVQPLNSWFAIVKISMIIWHPTLFHPNQQGELVVTWIFSIWQAWSSLEHFWTVLASWVPCWRILEVLGLCPELSRSGQMRVSLLMWNQAGS